MKKKFFFVLMSLLSFAESEAQKDSLRARPDRFVFSFSAGLVFPGSNFTKNDPYPPKMGKAYKMEFMYLPVKILGFNFSFSKTVNETQIPTEPVVEHFGGLGNPHPTVTYIYWSGAWRTNNFFADLVFQPNTRAAQFCIKVGAGLQEIMSPPVRVYYPSSNYSDNAHGTKSRAFVFHAGLDLRINLFKGISLLLSEDFYDSVVDLPSASTSQKNIIFSSMSVGVAYAIP